MASDNRMTDRELLEEISAELRENTRMTRALLHRARFQNVAFFLKWLIYIGIAIGVYSYLSPFIDQLVETYSALQESANSINEIKEKSASLNLNSVLDLLK